MSELKRLREAKGLSQVELSKLARVPAETISRLERGRRRARFSTRRKLSRALDVPIEENLAVFGPWPLDGPRLRLRPKGG